MDHTYMCIDLFLYDDSGYGDDWRQVSLVTELESESQSEA